MDLAFKTTCLEVTRHSSASHPSHQFVSWFQRIQSSGMADLQQSLERDRNIGTNTLHSKMKKLELEKLNLNRLCKIGFPSIDFFSYSS